MILSQVPGSSGPTLVLLEGGEEDIDSVMAGDTVCKPLALADVTVMSSQKIQGQHLSSHHPTWLYPE